MMKSIRLRWVSGCNEIEGKVGRVDDLHGVCITLY